MKSLKLENNDLCIQSKQLQIVEGIDQEVQRTQATIQVVKGELFYNANLGLDYTQVLSVNEKNVSNQRKELAIRDAISKDSNVEKITSLSLNSDENSRKLNVALELKYKDSEMNTNVGGVTIG